MTRLSRSTSLPSLDRQSPSRIADGTAAVDQPIDRFTVHVTYSRVAPLPVHLAVLAPCGHSEPRTAPNRAPFAFPRASRSLTPRSARSSRLEREGVDGLACLEPLDEPAGLVGVVVVGEIVVDARDGADGEAVASDRDEGAVRIVGFLLEVDDALAVELDESVGTGELVGANVVGGERRGRSFLEVVDELSEIEADEVVTGGDDGVLGESLVLDLWARVPTTPSFSSSWQVSSTESCGFSKEDCVRYRVNLSTKRSLVLT